MKIRILIIVACVCSLFLAVPSAFSQGGLTPPGAPAPTMKTLQQVEPRTDVLTLPAGAVALYKISKPGSYYLTTNIICQPFVAGIEIAANDVTLDLNGFAILGTYDDSDDDGIDLDTSVENAKISNGTISGCGNGIWGNWCFNCRFERLLLSDNTQQGMLICQQCQVVNCLARNNAYNGFFIRDGTCTDCRAEGNYSGIYVEAGGVLINCVASGNTSDGIVVSSNCVVQGCLANTNGGHGILANNDNTITGCIASQNGTNGIEVASACAVVNNTCNMNKGNGIYASGNVNRIDSNHAMDNLVFGIKVESDMLNLVVRNSAGGITDGVIGFSIPSGNTWGPIIRLGHTADPIPSPATGWENFDSYWP